MSRHINATIHHDVHRVLQVVSRARVRNPTPAGTRLVPKMSSIQRFKDVQNVNLEEVYKT